MIDITKKQLQSQSCYNTVLQKHPMGKKKKKKKKKNPQSTVVSPPSWVCLSKFSRMGLVRITSWYPNFNGSHFGLPPSSTHEMTGLGGKFVWTMTYSHRAPLGTIRLVLLKEVGGGEKETKGACIALWAWLTLLGLVLLLFVAGSSSHSSPSDLYRRDK